MNLFAAEEDVDRESKEETWKFYFDGAMNQNGSGVGAVLISPEDAHIPISAELRLH
jgi:hypothetical protein